MDRLVRFCSALALTLLVACTTSTPRAQVAKSTALPNVLAQLDPARLTEGVPGIGNYTIRFVNCGFWNAFAVHDEKEILLCSELAYTGPRVMRAVLLHEAAHVGFEHGMPFTGMEELAADEYAAVRSIWEGRREDVDAIAEFWSGRCDAQGLACYTDFGRSHPNAYRRYLHAKCLYVGSGPAPDSLNEIGVWYYCRRVWKTTSASWHKMLGK